MGHRAAAAGLPPIDSHDLWPYLSGQARTSPRTELAIGDVGQVGGLISVGEGGVGLVKLLLGELSQSGWTGPVYPNTTGPKWDSARPTPSRAEQRPLPRPARPPRAPSLLTRQG